MRPQREGKNNCEQGLGIKWHQPSQQQFRKLEFSIMLLVKNNYFPSQLLMLSLRGRIDTVDMQNYKPTPMHSFEKATEGCSPSKQENTPVKMKTWIQKQGIHYKREMKNISYLMKEKHR